ncbi:MAG: OmpA family protein [Flavobacteriaceae bacterium]|tara:strand:- start:1128 stop:2729 length:1602 start_codon:yes stop_codon:yes gene_type:complete
MKTKLCFFVFLVSFFTYSQGSSTLVANNNFSIDNKTSKSNSIETNGFEFQLLDAGINSKYSEFGSGFFRDKLILVSSKKIGGLAKIDSNTNEAYKELFYFDVSASGALSSPGLFSTVLNTEGSEDQLTFSPDEKTVYYTRSSKENSLEYKLYKATFDDNTREKWVNNVLLAINKAGVSIETPYLSPKGDKLYFSANLPDSFGGYDIYVSKVNADGTLGTPENIGSTINTTKNEKYPSLSKDTKYLYFSSQGHENIGGYDLFVSKILSTSYKTPRNLGNTINTPYDEVAYFLATKNKGYVSSNKPKGMGGFDIYTAVYEEVKQTLKGKILDLETQIKLPNALVILKDEENNEVSRIVTKDDATYSFDVIPFESYTVTVQKDGFKDAVFAFTASRSYETAYYEDLQLLTTEPVIAEVDEELRIVIENIYFDTEKYSIKEESHISLNKIVKVLKEHPEMKLAINAHTDNKGRASYNLKLSNQRAASALKYILANGITKNRLISKGFGETKPLIDCKTNCSDDDLQANRRVEFVILH